ncbi:hypothetical protein THAOC_15512 [Thalassiosira oceanica]|uniref:Uncharacterized protein n=1 Tax=Thalassiosira oceanica TaxID=159749 RepID=K0SEP8_THAOC|nr:hypothetical protein THAOC_15512 [Thalassiosira oceanica]|mmetsp:Transcript_22759/g.53718  ORF Transcript_22759/g.53718 Transcript_22759/m.53718 type:complete len:139 (+) Transcript_22759:168-584(+)|eukprot:EJK63815.1 hypothetical protein THAOC_15512 [Thalassiosira oceanica]
MQSTQSTTPPSRPRIDSTAARSEGRTPSAQSRDDAFYLELAELLLQPPAKSAPSTHTQDSRETPSGKIRPREPIDPSLCDGFGDLVRGTAIVARKIKHSDRLQKVRGKFRGKGSDPATKRTASVKQQPDFDSSDGVFV